MNSVASQRRVKNTGKIVAAVALLLFSMFQIYAIFISSLGGFETHKKNVI